ncbi:MAG: nitrile hydratase accessory protein [Pseudomonadota bacterium]
MNPSEDGAQRFRTNIPGNLLEDGEPIFAEPWQAQVFAMTIALYEKGLFSWDEWAAALSEQRGSRSPALDDGAQHYYQDWLSALEGVVSSRTDADVDLLAGLSKRWEQAYRSTPHGEKVTLD